MTHKTNKTQKTHELLKHTLVLLAVIGLYLIGKSIPLWGVVADTNQASTMDAQAVISTILHGTESNRSLMAVGIFPYMNAMILVQLASFFRSSEAKARMSQNRTQRWTGILTFFIALIYAYNLTNGIEYETIFQAGIMRVLVIIQMLIGVLLLFFLLEWNKKDGLGISAPIIMVNIIAGLSQTLKGVVLTQYPVLLAMISCIVVVMAVMENVLIKVKVQRVSIDNSHADKSYLAFKLNPIGVMPMMFAAAVFMLVSVLVRLPLKFLPDNQTLKNVADNMAMTKQIGFYTYLFIIILLAVLFAFLILNPSSIAEGLQKAGDSIVNVPAGKKTKRYLVTLLLGLSLFSGIFQCACVWLAYFMSKQGYYPTKLVTLPTSAMLLTSFMCSTFYEVRSHFRYDTYKLFL